MSAAGGTVRSRRSERAPARPVVAVTGAASGLGHRLTEHLSASAAVRRVVAIDERRGDVEGVTWRVVDVRDTTLVDRLSGVDVVVHLAVDHSPEARAQARRDLHVRGTQTVLTAAAAASVPRVVLCTSAAVYGAQPENPVPLPEDAPLHALPDDSLVGDLLEIERLARRAPRAHPGLSVTVVRPAMLVGPGVDTVLTRHFESPLLLVVRDTEPRWQFCHVDDLVTALETAALGDLDGAVTVGCEGSLSQAEVEALTGRRRIELPASLAFGTADRLHRLGLAPASDLRYVAYPWVVPSTRLREAGWAPTHDNTSALQALLEEVAGRHAVAARRVGRRDAAAVGAAGATVAVLGTAALVRRARRRRRTRG